MLCLYILSSPLTSGNQWSFYCLHNFAFPETSSLLNFWKHFYLSYFNLYFFWLIRKVSIISCWHYYLIHFPFLSFAHLIDKGFILSMSTNYLSNIDFFQCNIYILILFMIFIQKLKIFFLVRLVFFYGFCFLDLCQGAAKPKEEIRRSKCFDYISDIGQLYYSYICISVQRK